MMPENVAMVTATTTTASSGSAQLKLSSSKMATSLPTSVNMTPAASINSTVGGLTSGEKSQYHTTTGQPRQHHR